MKYHYEIVAEDRNFFRYWFNGKCLTRQRFYVESQKKAEKFFREAKDILDECKVKMTVQLNKIELDENIPTSREVMKQYRTQLK